ncbi:MAG: phasin family protein [Pseudomonadota bacterium]
MPEKDKMSNVADKSPALKTAAQDMVADMATLQSLRFDTMTSTGAAWLETVAEMGSEVASFVAERIREDVKTQHEILHCNDVNELRQIQMQFMQKALEQYTAETGKLVEMGQNFFAAQVEKRDPPQ